jgi:hypothetical protein
MLPTLTESPSLVILRNDITEIKGDVAKHHKILIEGNGEIPLVEKVRNHDVFIGEMKYWMKFIIGALVLQTITFGTAALIWFMKLSPILEKLTNTTP